MNNPEKNLQKNKPQKVAALQYDPESDSAPRLTAYGRGDIAEKILQVAHENDIPIHHDQALVEILSSLDIGSEIPEELYEVVAEILAFVYRLSNSEIEF